MKITHAIVILILALSANAGCKQQENSSEPGKVTTTSAYEKAFGPAPPVDKGTAFAFVIYFPLAKEPSKVVPFPFFTFDEASMKKIAIERLLSGMDTGSYQGEFMTSPPGTRIVSITDDKGAVTVTLSKVPESLPLAIALTLQQFKGVSTVHILEDGSQNPLKVVADETAIRPPGPPRLLSVVALRDKGAKEIEEVDAYFDRPVEVEELKLMSGDGEQLPGDLYHSVFDMAGVLKPKDRAQLKEQMPVHVRWKVVDKLGRQAQGDKVWQLEVKEH
ncbi:germane superfamily lipoprotein, putative [Geotalea daltonii FRC-32]|uniref:Germane superfamily lipoprotein, putative n=1 Tax=Geotalea daltonii (strain DSM 22248 / JCM 15807 / FRC-32) TaxID=316067 RepID=B9M0R5_GEODF|nr:GerMN domain-containing protein [Geotalea daltonii]ACM20918.1 germane superfamily lipoprotein, putative [Geotalea daltonii FRC-32]